MANEFVIDINVEGIDELRRKLRSEVAATPTRKFLQRSGDSIIGKAKPACSVPAASETTPCAICCADNPKVV